MINLEFVRNLTIKLCERCSIEPNNIQIYPENPPPNVSADFAINCFRIAHQIKESPEQTAKLIEKILSEDSSIESVSRIKAFVNLRLNADALHSQCLDLCKRALAEPILPSDKRQKILIEFSSPNTNKPLHLGHLRNNALGDAVSRILSKTGHEVIKTCLVNDRGIHICKSMLAYKLFSSGETPESCGKKGDHLVGDYYVKFDLEFKRQLDELKKSKPELKDKEAEELFTQTPIGIAAQEMLKKWEEGDEEVRNLWQMMNKWVLDGFNETYRKMGISFDKTYYESQTYLLGREIVEDALKKGIFKRRDDNAIFADLEKYSLGKKILLRADGTSVYITQDLGTTLLKQSDFSPDRQIWVVGDEQNHHFKTLFAILNELGYEWAGRLLHLSYGMVNLPSGKMKSREGTVVDADDLFDELFNLAKQATLERLGGEAGDNIDERARIISMGALKFMLLKFNAKTTITFDPQASVKFEGDTGPYIQYACARINSILRKFAEKNITLPEENANFAKLSSTEERQLSTIATAYPIAISQAAEKFDPSILANYLLELAKAFSRFYREHSVLNAEDEEIRNARVILSLNIRDILRDGLSLLGISAPDAM